MEVGVAPDWVPPQETSAVTQVRPKKEPFCRFSKSASNLHTGAFLLVFTVREETRRN